MRVALDATPLSLATGGLRRYAEELARALAAGFREDEYLLVSDQPFETALELKRGTPPRNVLERRWWLYGLPRELARQRVSVFHGTNFEAPLLPFRPSVVTIHDLSPWKRLGGEGGGGRVRRRTPLILRLGLAKMVITVSETVRREAISYFGLHPERVAAIPLAAAPHFRPATGSSRAPYFLYVGAIEPRKNVETVIAAWREIRRSGVAVDLVLAGKVRGVEIAAEPGLELMGEAPEAELASLYSGAVACLYPSLYEGFGLPVLEAMQCGAPVIASRDAAVSEIAGGAAVQADAGDVRGWAEAMSAFACRPEWRSEWRDRGLARAGEYSWEKTARKTHEVYVEALGRYRA